VIVLFNDKEIEIMKRSDEPVVDEHGKASYKWQYIGTYKVDVQPITQEKCKRMFGTYPNVKYEVWLEDAIDDFNTTDFKVIYKNKEYEILNIIEWDDDWFCYNFILGVDLIG
jgi:hypothetical protein